MSLHVIVGAGPVGSGVARQLAARGERVRLVTRSGSGPEDPAVERVAADATDAATLRELTRGAVALYNCANPQYNTWVTHWPPLAAALLAAAESSGAVLAVTSNLYGYGPVDVPMTEDLPLTPTTVKGGVRAAMWRDQLAAHEAGRIRMTEVRGSDYIEANSLFPLVLAKPLLTGRAAYIPADVDVPHSFTSVTDVARTLVTVAADERAWGRAWHVPTNPARTIRELATRFTELAGSPAPRLRNMPTWVLRAAGLFNPLVKEFVEMNYQFRRPFVVDSSAAQTTFGLAPVPFDDALAVVIANARRADSGRQRTRETPPTNV
jgi:nucleoside-diphosphate-sugar epimerase